jgi:hypothetical protein
MRFLKYALKSTYCELTVTFGFASNFFVGLNKKRLSNSNAEPHFKTAKHAFDDYTEIHKKNIKSLNELFAFTSTHLTLSGEELEVMTPYITQMNTIMNNMKCNQSSESWEKSKNDLITLEENILLKLEAHTMAEERELNLRTKSSCYDLKTLAATAVAQNNMQVNNSDPILNITNLRLQHKLLVKTQKSVGLISLQMKRMIDAISNARRKSLDNSTYMQKMRSNKGAIKIAIIQEVLMSQIQIGTLEWLNLDQVEYTRYKILFLDFDHFALHEDSQIHHRKKINKEESFDAFPFTYNLNHILAKSKKPLIRNIILNGVKIAPSLLTTSPN